MRRDIHTFQLLHHNQRPVMHSTLAVSHHASPHYLFRTMQVHTSCFAPCKSSMRRSPLRTVRRVHWTSPWKAGRHKSSARNARSREIEKVSIRWLQCLTLGGMHGDKDAMTLGLRSVDKRFQRITHVWKCFNTCVTQIPLRLTVQDKHCCALPWPPTGEATVARLEHCVHMEPSVLLGRAQERQL